MISELPHFSLATSKKQSTVSETFAFRDKHSNLPIIYKRIVNRIVNSSYI